MQPRIPNPVTEQQLEDWISDTVGWAALEVSGEAFLAANVHPLQVKGFVQAAFEAAARLNTPKCKFRQVDLDQGMARCISTALAAYPSLRSLVLQELNVYDEAVATLASGLLAAESLTKLSLRDADLSAAGWEALMHALTRSATIRHLKIRGQLPRPSMACLHKALKHSLALQVLDLNGQQLGDAGVGKLCDVLTHSGTLRVLSIQACSFGEGGVAGLCRLLRSCKHLASLDVSNNMMGAQGCADVAKALAGSGSLQQLWAARAGWDDVAVQHLVASLVHCSKLTALDLSYSNVTYRGSHVLAAVALVTPLSVVKLSGNSGVGTQGVASWAEVLATPRRPLAVLALADCEAKDDAALALAAALRAAPDATNLETLDVASNQFTPNGVGALARAARVHPSLRCLDVSFNWLGPRAMAACTQASASARHSHAGTPPSHRISAAGGASLRRGASVVPPSLVPRPPLEVRSEVLQEFRDIEGIKYSWAGAGPPKPFGNPGATDAGDATDAPGPNPFLADPASRGGQTAATPFTLPAQPPDPAGLRPGYALPAGLGRGASSGSDATRSTVSTETHVSSGSVSSVHSAVGLGHVGVLHAREPMGSGSGAGPHASRLDGLHDGSINSALPVSFGASSMDEQMPRGADSKLVVGPGRKEQATSGAGLGLPVPKSARGSGGGAGLPGRRAGGVQAPGPAEAAPQPGMHQHHRLTLQAVQRLNESQEPMAPGELLLMAARRHAVTHAVPCGGDVAHPAPPEQPLGMKRSAHTPRSAAAGRPDKDNPFLDHQRSSVQRRSNELEQDNPFRDPQAADTAAEYRNPFRTSSGEGGEGARNPFRA